MTKEVLEQAVFDYIGDYIGEKFKDKVVDKRVQTFFTYSELVDTVLSFAELLNKNIEEFEQENTELKKEVIENKSDCLTCYPHIKERLEKQLAQAKDLIKNILRVTWGEGWNYSLDWKVKAEQFLKEIEK